MNVKRYKRASANVIDETIDCDTLIVNLSDGHYFSISKSASIIWNLLINNYSEEQIIKLFIEKYPDHKEVIPLQIVKYINDLVDENLILENSIDAVSNEQELRLLEHYDTPEISKFVDMEALLLADPIHELKDED